MLRQSVCHRFLNWFLARLEFWRHASIPPTFAGILILLSFEKNIAVPDRIAMGMLQHKGNLSLFNEKTCHVARAWYFQGQGVDPLLVQANLSPAQDYHILACRVWACV